MCPDSRVTWDAGPAATVKNTKRLRTVSPAISLTCNGLLPLLIKDHPKRSIDRFAVEGTEGIKRLLCHGRYEKNAAITRMGLIGRILVE